MAIELPPGITCPDYQTDPNDPKGRRCLHYAAGGECRHEVRVLRLETVCIEWEKAKLKADAAKGDVQLTKVDTSTLRSAAEVAVKPPVMPAFKTPSAASLIALPPGARPSVQQPPQPPNGAFALGASPPRQTAAERARAAFTGVETVERKKLGILEPPAFTAAKEISPESIEALEKAVEEIHLVSEDLGDLWIVRKKTGKDRLELSFSEMSTLRLLVDSFPGARIISVVRPDDDR